MAEVPQDPGKNKKPVRVPKIPGKEAVRAFERAGFRLDRVCGSHHILKKAGHRYNLSIPVHANKTVGTGLLASQIQAAGLTLEQFIAVL